MSWVKISFKCLEFVGNDLLKRTPRRGAWERTGQVQRNPLSDSFLPRKKCCLTRRGIRRGVQKWQRSSEAVWECGEARPRRWYLLLGHEFTAGCPSVGKHHPRPITYLSDACYISLSAYRSTFRRRLHHVLRCVFRFSIFFKKYRYLLRVLLLIFVN